VNARPMGIAYDMPFDEYLAVEAVSSSGLRNAARSMWHYRNRVDIEQTRPMLRGSLAHCAVLEPDALEKRYVVTPADAPKRPTAAQWTAKSPNDSSRESMRWWSDFNASLKGREVVTFDEFSITQMQLDAIRQVRELASLLASGRGEVSIFWIDVETGLYCKARPDWLSDGVMLDLKTCADESPSGFGRAAARLRYDLQEAHYTAGIRAATKRSADFIFGAVTNKPPVLAVPYVLTDEVRDNARDERDELMRRLAQCQRDNEWPAYGTGVQLLDFPAYMKAAGEVEVEWSE
jgi:PDDEXK-like uncharacterized protein DUF3799